MHYLLQIKEVFSTHDVGQQPGHLHSQGEVTCLNGPAAAAFCISHRRAVERLHEERDEARAAVEALQAQVEEERQQGAVAVEEVRVGGLETSFLLVKAGRVAGCCCWWSRGE